jgi:glycosyltransferase involved in cell wall biosynthesis
MKPRVSVLIPTYNRPRLLAEALASVLSQDFDLISANLARASAY